MQVSVKNINGDTVDKLEMDDLLFGATMNKSVVHQAMVMYLANRRQGTHSTKTRSQVSGGGRKPWRQKYMNRARHGSIRSPLWKGGGVVFGPHPRDHRQDMPKKMRHLALRCMLSEKLRQDKLVVVDQLSRPLSKTKEMIKSLSALGIESSALVVASEPDFNVVRSCGNLRNIRILPVALINTGELLSRDVLLMTVEAVHRAEALWGQQSFSKEKHDEKKV